MKQTSLGIRVRKAGFILVFSFFLITESCLVTEVMAEWEKNLAEVTIVENERQMIAGMIKGMRRHQTSFTYYYPGIEEDFNRYRNKGDGYAEFWEKLSKKDGYITGIVSGVSIAICGDGKRYISIQFGYLLTKRQERYIDRKVRAIVKKLGRGTRAVRVKRAHDYLVQHMRYDRRYCTPYSAFKKGRGSCMSYALAYQRLMQEMKIPCIYVAGKAHAWNMVKLGSVWYNVDVTWDDAGNDYRYFLKADRDFPGHKRPASAWFSSLPKARFSYPFYRIRP